MGHIAYPLPQSQNILRKRFSERIKPLVPVAHGDIHVVEEQLMFKTIQLFNYSSCFGIYILIPVFLFFNQKFWRKITFDGSLKNEKGC